MSAAPRESAAAGRPEAGDSVQTVEKAMEVLEVVAAAGGSGVRLADVVARTSLSKSTAHRLLGALVRAGMLDQDAASRSYFLGFRLVGLGDLAANRLGLVDLGTDIIESLAARTQDTVYLSARRGTESVCLARASGTFPIKIITLSVGDRSPLGSGAGSLALLAALPEPEMREIVRTNSRLAYEGLALDEPSILKLVDEARRSGYVRTDGRIVVGMSSIGVPVVATNGLPIAAISLAAITDRLSPARSPQIVELLKSEAAALARRLETSIGTPSRRMLDRIVGSGRRSA